MTMVFSSEKSKEVQLPLSCISMLFLTARKSQAENNNLCIIGSWLKSPSFASFACADDFIFHVQSLFSPSCIVIQFGVNCISARTKKVCPTSENLILTKLCTVFVFVFALDEIKVNCSRSQHQIDIRNWSPTANGFKQILLKQSIMNFAILQINEWKVY